MLILVNVKMDNYIKSLFNKKEFSDFTIIGEDTNQSIYVHKLILLQSPYFRTYFSTQLGKDDKCLKLRSYSAAFKLTQYLYIHKLDIDPDKTDPDDFFHLTGLVEMWQLWEVQVMLFMHLHSLWKRILEQEILFANIMYQHFGSHKQVMIGKEEWSGEILTRSIVNYLEKNLKQLPAEALDWAVCVFLSKEKRIEFVIQQNMYDKLNPKDLHIIRPLILKYYDESQNIFTHRQISFIKRLHEYHGSLEIESFMPFKGTFYKHVGEILSNDVNGRILVKLCKKVKVKDIIQTHGKTYSVEQIYYDDTSVNVGYPKNIYRISLNGGFPIIDMSGSNICKVIEL